MPASRQDNITGLILAGGRARRMGGQDKGLLVLAGRPLVQHVHDRLAPQVEAVAISANRHLDDYRKLDCPVWADTLPGYAGPLAGMLTALERIDTDWLLTVPVDSPLLPQDLAARLFAAARESGRHAAVVTVAGQREPAFNLVHRDRQASLAEALADGERRLGAWLAQQSAVPVDFTNEASAFDNLNTPTDLQRLEKRLAS
ncbi:MAG TPA: molybdenum cofactor guanylyltransferase [Gammaproteobacteria bacterium]|nr:molybdenum cofactor guanylyltransferase [Gammaproteobacteria bacterium]